MVLIQRPSKVIGDALKSEFFGSLEKVSNVFVQLALILLHRQQIVGVGLDDLPGGLLLAAHGVDGDDASVSSSSCSSLGMAVISLDFSSPWSGPAPSIGRGPNVDHVDGLFTQGAVMGAPHRLAVDGHHFALGELGHGLYPLNETEFGTALGPSERRHPRRCHGRGFRWAAPGKS